MNIKKLSWLPAVILMIVIFFFSSRPADNSNKGSMTIANEVLTIYENITDIHYEQTERIDIMEIINHYVRKGSHFCEYALLACAFALHLLAMKKSRKLQIAVPILLSALYASTDEYHQTFVPGRSGQISDVLLDTSGAATGALIFAVITAIVISVINKRKKEKANYR